MPQDPLSENGKLEKTSPRNWLGLASTLTERLKQEPSKNSVERSTLYENLGYSLYRASMQSRERSEFLERIRESIEAYKTATGSYRVCKCEAEAFRCKAMQIYLSHWTTGSISERKRLLSDAWQLTSMSLESFRRNQDHTSFARTYNQLAMTAGLMFLLEWNVKARTSLSEQAVEYGREAIKQFADNMDKDGLARAYAIVSGFVGILSNHSGPEKKGRLLAESDNLWNLAVKTSEKAAFLERTAHSRFSMAQSDSEILGSDLAIAAMEKAVGYAREARDNIVIATALDMLAYNLFFKMTTIEDPDESRTLEGQTRQLLKESSRLYAPFSSGLPPHSLPALATSSPDYYWHLAKLEEDEGKKLEWLRAGLNEIPLLLATCKKSSIPDAISNAEHVASKILAGIAVLEQDHRRKETLLQRAFLHRRRSIMVTEKVRGPADFWNVGINDGYLADIQAERLQLLTSPKDKQRVLLKAISLKEQSLKLCARDNFVLNWGSAGPSPYYGALGRYQIECGDMYRKLYGLRQNPVDLRQASQRYMAAAESFQKLDQRARMGGAYLKAALVLDEISDHIGSSKAYSLSHDNYKLAAQKIRSLRKFYEELSNYMKARSEAEKARDEHAHGDYALAQESYRRAAELQQSSGQWCYLSTGLLALARLEGAEDKSAKHLGEEASRAFEEAARAFHESRISIETHIVDKEIPEDKQEAEALKRSSLSRESYCLAREGFEEARILQMKGDQRSAGEKYDRAIETLRALAQQLQNGPDVNEANYIIAMSRAWQTMAQADAESSPMLYESASSLFDEVTKRCSSEKARLLLRGHSRYCASLEAASRFLDSGKTSDYHVAVQRLESASNYYIASGFHDASEQSKGTKRLLEAHLNLNIANRERDHQKKAQLYGIVERLLRSSAEAFGESGYDAKKNYITSLMDRVREEKELAISLSTDLSAPLVLPSGVFPSSILSSDSASEIGRLQGAFVVANVFSSPSSPRLGEPMSLKIELANAGMNTAQLVRVERAVPEGFELLEKPKEVLIQERHLILKGWRLDPLQTEELNIRVRPNVEGTLALRPRILYLDEKGQRRIHEPDPVEVVVKDPSADVQTAPSLLERTLDNSPTMRFLVEAFVQDYMRRRLSVEGAGWRGLLDICKSLRIPRSHVYGDARYGHTFGKPLERLVKKGIVEFRIFPGSRGRGGNIVKVRVAYEKEPVKRLVDSVALTVSS